ncbi:MAG TPA: ECF transporter S component [Candidatus Limnocylindrales bacterium]
MMTTSERAPAVTLADPRWRTRDILVTAVLGVAFGVVFWFWNNLAWSFLAPLGPFQNLFYAVWLIPAVLAPLIVRKPGAALFAELLAAAVSVIAGSPWSLDVLLSGFVQGAAAELVFAFTLYRAWSLPVLAIAALASAAAAWVHDWVIYYPTVAVETQLLVGAAMGVSALLIVGVGSLVLVRALRGAGVLEGFPR